MPPGYSACASPVLSIFLYANGQLPGFKLHESNLELAPYVKSKNIKNVLEAIIKFDSLCGPNPASFVFLNLFNNAFYSLNEKIKRPGALTSANDINYKPTLILTTKKLDASIEISIKDNGMGMSQKVVNKIFQPFFTTKPTGHGPGLGLSISYDIIKAHTGEVKVETKEGEFAEFIIHLPYT